MKNAFLKKLFSKKVTAIIILILIVGGGFFWYKKANSTSTTNKYVVSAIEKGSVINSIAGSGQVSTSDTISIKPKVSGDIKTINVAVNQEVKKGDIIATIDSSDAQKTVRDAQSSLTSAKLSLEKLSEPSDALTITQAENSLAQAKRNLADLQNPNDSLTITQAENSLAAAKESLEKSKSTLNDAYSDSYNTISNVFLDLPSVMTGLNNVLFNNGELSSGQDNIDFYSDIISRYDAAKGTSFTNSAKNSYTKAKSAYDDCFSAYKSISRSSSKSEIEEMLNKTSDTVTLISEAIKNSDNLIRLYQDELNDRNLEMSQKSSTHLSNISSYTSKINTLSSNLSSQKNTLQNNKDSITSNTRTVTEKQASLDRLNAGTDADDLAAAQESVNEKQLSLDKIKNNTIDALELRSAQLSIQDKQNSLSDALEKLNDYTVKASADGVISAVALKVGDSASSGTAIATLVSKQKIAEVSLGETDIIKIKTGQKATFTFDAIEGLTLTGEVAEVGNTGTTTSGVVAYAVKITFDSDDDRVKSGMSFSVNIITESKLDIIVVPTSAIKSSGEESYVEMPDETIAENQLGLITGIELKNKTKKQTIQTGLTDGANTEIISGLLEGDKVITKTIKPSTSTSTTKSSTSSTTKSSTTKSTTSSVLGGNTMGGSGMPAGGPPN